MRIDGASVFVLHRRAWRDTSLLVELLSADHGRIGAVARGARNPRSALFGLVEPFRELQASWSRRGEMATLSALDSDRPPVRLVGRALWCGLYANELILRLLPRDDPEPGLYAAYRALLPDLTEPVRQAAALRRFEVSLLSVLGLMPALDRCATDGQPVQAEASYRVDPTIGPSIAPETGSMSAGEGMDQVRGRVLLALARGVEIQPGDARIARAVMRKLIDHQLDGRPLKTRSLIREEVS